MKPGRGPKEQIRERGYLSGVRPSGLVPCSMAKPCGLLDVLGLLGAAATLETSFEKPTTSAFMRTEGASSHRRGDLTEAAVMCGT